MVSREAVVASRQGSSKVVKGRQIRVVKFEVKESAGTRARSEKGSQCRVADRGGNFAKRAAPLKPFATTAEEAEPSALE